MINRLNFKIKDYPTFDPIIDKWDRRAWWADKKRKIFEGEWIGGKWICGELYYYINFHNIIKEVGIYRQLALPDYRDLEDEKANIYTEAIGFSGFEGDDKYSCHRELKRLEDGLTTKEDIINNFCRGYNVLYSDKKIYENLFKADGTPKKYIDARDYLKKIHNGNLGKPYYNNEAKHIIDLESRGGGKDLHEDTIVHSNRGKIKIKDIKIGDKIYGRDGILTKVISKKHYKDQVQYRITTKDGRSLIAGGGHLWGIIDRYGNKKILTTDYIRSKYKHLRNDGGVDYYYFLPMCEPMQYEEKSLQIDPYFLGLWLGDGTSHRIGISTIDKEISDYVYKIANNYECNVSINHSKNQSCPTYFITKGNVGNHDLNKLLQSFKSLNLFNNKHIPEEYFYGSEYQRMELLRGLLDSDGHCGDKGQIDFSTTLDSLKNDIVRLLDGLGIKNTSSLRITKCNGKEFLSYRVNIVTSKDVFKLPRKLERLNKTPSKYALANREKTAIVNIEQLTVMPSVCIGVDNSDNLFVAGERFMVTHNSFWGSALIAHNYMTDGIKDYDYWLECKENGTPMKSETGVGAVDAKFSNDLLDKVKQAFSNYYDSHVIKVDNDYVTFPSPLYVPYTGSFMPGKQITSIRSKSQIQHRTLQDNGLAFNGTRGNRYFLEEVGFLSNILEAWEAIEATQASAQFKRTSIIGFGTGGLTQGGAAMHVHEIFYNPEHYGCLVFDDIWENKGKIGYFVPGEMTLNKFKTGDNKETDREKALAFIEEEREKAKKSPTRTKLMGTIINKPLVPSEIFLRMEGTFFPVQDLKMRLAELESVNSILSATYKYELNLKDSLPLPQLSQKPVIREFPLRKGFDMDACIEVFELPKKGADGKVFGNRYIAGWDPVEYDGNEDTERSLQSVFIMDLWTERIVAEYTARTYLAEEYYEQVRRLLLYYNAVCNYESNIKGPYGYFKNKNSLHLLVETPEILKDQNLIKTTGVGNKSLGTSTNDSIINWSLGLILTWLESQAYDKEEGIRNLDALLSVGLLKELISFSRDINTDRVSALGMLMILKADRARITEMAKNSSIKTKSQDKFWDRAYNGGKYRQLQQHIKSL